MPRGRYGEAVPARVGLVVVNYNSAHLTRALLGDVPAALDGLDGEVVVVDNGSQDDSLEVLAGLSGITVVPASNEGYSAGLNRGIAALAQVDAVVALNPDLRLAAGSLRRLVERLGEGPDGARVGITAPLVRDADGSTSWSLRRDPSLLRSCGLGSTGRPALSEYVRDPRAYDHAHAVDWALGACLAVSWECAQEIGPWDESYFLYSEETDYCMRARDLGWQVWFEPDAQVTHEGGGSGVSDALHEMQVVNRVRLVHRRHGTLYGWAYLLACTAQELWWARKGHTRNRRAAIALLVPSRRSLKSSRGSLLPQ
ncbi:hypothetical protein AWH69_01575 [Janibacter melonis]|uniref:Glycosyltransferase 2-like domain-containing protein n=1 Tax=Janibacter melonis TaxID=262209 RepID=A0A176QFR1_9MICO|nr:hypothetical protein AWH69_01575 [Janibacter melonis]